MDITQYLSESGCTQAQFARDIGAQPVLVHQWIKGARQVPAERCPVIERVTDGAVRCEDLRPDVDWAYLRGTSHTEAA